MNNYTDDPEYDERIYFRKPGKPMRPSTIHIQRRDARATFGDYIRLAVPGDIVSYCSRSWRENEVDGVAPSEALNVYALCKTCSASYYAEPDDD